MKAPVVVDIIKNIVSATSLAMYGNAPGATVINYMHGHPREITESLQEMTKNPTASAGKYPVIALFQDFDENVDGDFVRLKLNMIIGTLTDPKYKAAERYTVNFTPTLYPIYELLLNKLSRSGYFAEASERDVKHTKIDRLYWGRNGLYGNEGNIFNDYIDCIELRDLKLNLKLKNC